MTTYVVLLRGINVGGQNKVSMAALTQCLEDMGHTRVRTYLASGNVIPDSTEGASEIQAQIEQALPLRFKLDDEIVRVLVLTRAQFKAIANARPDGFGAKPGKYYSDAIFLTGIKTADTMEASPRDGVDQAWPGRA